jgi:hypothetical protein
MDKIEQNKVKISNVHYLFINDDIIYATFSIAIFSSIMYSLQNLQIIEEKNKFRFQFCKIDFDFLSANVSILQKNI